MKTGMREFDSRSIEWFKGAVFSGDYTRSGLARGLCERSGWCNHQGVPCEVRARKILPRPCRSNCRSRLVCLPSARS